jgi:DNA-binding response OmpR family regulator
MLERALLPLHYSLAMPKVLLVADEPWIENHVKAALSSRSDVLLHESDPTAVAELVLEWRPDLVLVDLQVGTMGGMAVVRAIRDAVLADGAPRMAVVMLLDRSADAFLARRSGAGAWLAKPFTAHQLRTAVEEAARVAAA